MAILSVLRDPSRIAMIRLPPEEVA
jgi:hypothetical protein